MPPDPEAFLVEQVRAHRMGLRYAGLLLAFICVFGGLALAAMYRPGDHRDETMAEGIASVPIGILLAAILFASGARNPRKHRALKVLLQNPRSVRSFSMELPPRPRWTQTSRLRKVPGIVAESMLWLELEDGKRVALEVQAGDEEAASAAVRRLLARPTSGQ
jgi:hypothetical protein